MSSAVHDALSAVTHALEGVGQGWYLFGAQAALLRGSRRLTSDIDITLLPGDVTTDAIITRLAEHGISLRVEDADDFVAQTRVLPLVHGSGIPIDLVLGGPGLEQLFLDAAEKVEFPEFTIPVATTEHLVVMKLLAGRPKDLDDAEAMVRAARLDLTPVEQLVDAIAEGLGEDDTREGLAQLRKRLERS